MAAQDYFLKIDGIDGESQDDKHKNEIEVSSWSWGLQQQGSSAFGTGSGSGRAAVQDIHFTKASDKSSPNLMGFCASGKHFPKAILTVRRAGDKPHEADVMTMEDVLISSYSVSGAPNGDIPLEQFSLNFRTIEYKHTQQNKDGSAGAAITKKYDTAAHKMT